METQPSEADRLFRVFAQSGDPRALGEVYDLLAPELLRIALHATRDAAEAEDVLQATFLAAIERVESFDAERRILPWLVGILAHEARKARERAARRPDPERLERRAVAGPELDAERAELLARLDEALASVPAAFRPVLQLRLRHGLSVTEIAAALGCPSGTVRSQLARGTECLRKALPAGLAGALALVALPTRGLAAVRDAVLERAAVLHAPLIPASVLGGVLAVKKLVGAAVVLVVGLVLWNVGRSERAASDGPRASADAVLSAFAVAATPAPPASQRIESGEAREAQAPQPAPERHETAAAGGGSLVVHARWPDDSPAEGEIVLATPPSNRGEETLEQLTDASGTARFDGLEPGSWYVHLLRGRERPAHIDEGRPTEIGLEILAGVTVEGRVLDERGEPVAGADVWLSERFRNNVGHVLGHTDSLGAFTLRCVGPDHWIGARKRGYAPSTLRNLRGAVDERLALELRLDAAGASVQGRVVDRAGAPIADAIVQVGEEQPASVRIRDGSFVPAAPPQRARTDADGRFALDSAPLGVQPVQARARGFAPCASECDVLADEPNELTLVLVPEARVVGRVRDAGGRPLAEVTIRAGAFERLGGAFTFSGLDGRFELAGLGVGRVRLVAEHARLGRAEEELELRAGETSAWDVTLVAAPSLTGQVLDAHGRPLAGLVVLALRPDDHEQRQRSNVTRDDGSFVVSDLADEPTLVWVQSALGWREFPLLEVEGVRPGGAPLELRVPDASESGRITAEITADDGMPLAGAELQVWHEERGTWRSFVSAGERGAVVAERVPPGTVELELRHPTQPWTHLGTRRIEAGATLDLGRVAFEAAGRLRVRLSGVPDERCATLTAALSDASSRESGVPRLAPGELTAGPLAVGEHVLVLGGDGVRQVRRSFRVEAGAETALELALEPCGLREVELVLPEGVARPRWMNASLYDAEGALLWSGPADLTQDPPRVRVSAPPGTHPFIVRGGGLEGEAELLLPARGAELPSFRVVLLRTP